MDRIAASALLAASPAPLFSFLADPDNHWLLARGRIELLELDAGANGRMSARVAIRGPLGLRRTAKTKVLTSVAPAQLGGIAELGPRTRAEVSWSLEAVDDQWTRVVLGADIVNVSLLDRALLLLGGRAWMRRLFTRVLVTLSELGTSGHASGQERDAGSAAARPAAAVR